MRPSCLHLCRSPAAQTHVLYVYRVLHGTMEVFDNMLNASEVAHSMLCRQDVPRQVLVLHAALPAAMVGSGVSHPRLGGRGEV